MAGEIEPILEPKEDHYFPSGTNVMRTLRFMNVLEPGRASLSVSKIYLWLSLAGLLLVAILTPENIPALVATGANVFAATGNYAYRRKVSAGK